MRVNPDLFVCLVTMVGKISSPLASTLNNLNFKCNNSLITNDITHNQAVSDKFIIRSLHIALHVRKTYFIEYNGSGHKDLNLQLWCSSGNCNKAIWHTIKIRIYICFGFICCALYRNFLGLHLSFLENVGENI